MIGWLADLWQKATEVYGVNPAVFVGLYAFSFLPFYYGVFRVLRGAKRRSLDEVVAGVAINRFAWALPYLYVLAWGRNLPVWITTLVVVYVLGTGVWMTLQLRNASYRAKWEARLDRWLTRLAWIIGHKKPVRAKTLVGR